MKLWHIAVLLAAGMVVGAVFPGRLTGLFGEVTLYVFLPALIFEGAWNLDLREMRTAWRSISLLALPGVAVTAAIVAACAHYVGAFTWPAALLLGAILSATDPVAVIALFRRLPVPKRLATIVESEALLNDAVAVVLYRTILGISLGGRGFSTAWLAAAGVAGGVLIGGLIAWGSVLVLRARNSTAIHIALTLAGAYGAYLAAQSVQCSGIFAVIAFAVAFREMERRGHVREPARQVARFWDSTAVLANLVLFFLIGAALDFTRLRDTAPAAGVAIGAVLVSRIALAYGLLGAIRTHVQGAWKTVVRMAGVRGALSLALALATPVAIAQRGEIVDATFAVVVLTLLVGSLTFERRIRRLSLDDHLN